MGLLIRFIRIYTPFICTLMALVNGVLFKRGMYEIPAIDLLSAVSGSSILVVLYMFTTSMRMCIWYRLNLLCLLLVQISGLLYNYFDIDEALYLWVVVLLAAMGVIFFLVFRIFYVVTGRFGCVRRN